MATNLNRFNRFPPFVNFGQQVVLDILSGSFGSGRLVSLVDLAPLYTHGVLSSGDCVQGVSYVLTISPLLGLNCQDIANMLVDILVSE
jgi:hypothetical protein